MLIHTVETGFFNFIKMCVIDDKSPFFLSEVSHIANHIIQQNVSIHVNVEICSLLIIQSNCTMNWFRKNRFWKSRTTF